uniref:Uncharacterized protein n=1 Tax=Pipistrellus kuhlii TaxID=59472 RepID=A0A7J7W3P4_PIPKU|nr:hypothetical protein mPipKuh1_008204 [Pipistrellus kuhlii]
MSWGYRCLTEVIHGTARAFIIHQTAKTPHCISKLWQILKTMLWNLGLTGSINIGVSLKLSQDFCISHLEFISLQTSQNVLALSCLNSLPSIISPHKTNESIKMEINITKENSVFLGEHDSVHAEQFGRHFCFNISTPFPYGADRERASDTAGQALVMGIP